MKSAVSFFALIGLSGILLFSSCAKEDEVNPDDPTADDQSRFKGIGPFLKPARITENTITT